MPRFSKLILKSITLIIVFAFLFSFLIGPFFGKYSSIGYEKIKWIYFQSGLATPKLETSGQGCKSSIFNMEIPDDCRSLNRYIKSIRKRINRVSKESVYYVIEANTNNDLRQLLTLIFSLKDDGGNVCVHSVKETPPKKEKMLQLLQICLPDTFEYRKVDLEGYSTEKNGDWGGILGQIECLKSGLMQPWQYVVILDETVFPLFNNKFVFKYLKSYGTKNIVWSKPGGFHDSYMRRYCGDILANLTNADQEIQLKCGESFVALTRGSIYTLFKERKIDYLLDYMKKYKFKNILHIFWPTINYLFDQNPFISIENIQTSIELNPQRHKENTFITSLERSAFGYQCKGTYSNNLCVYGSRDFDYLMERHTPFARKFDIRRNCEILDKIIAHRFFI